MDTRNGPGDEGPPAKHQSHLFTLRVWSEEGEAGRAEWRGKVQHVTKGEARYFRDWATMLAFLLESLDLPAAKSERIKEV